jgi:hypothetical protein
MALLDANMALLTEANAPASASSNSPLEYPKVENGTVAGTSDRSDDYSFSPLQMSASGDFASTSQYSFDTPYYQNQHSSDASRVTFSAIHDAQSQDFGFGIGGNSGLWSF